MKHDVKEHALYYALIFILLISSMAGLVFVADFIGYTFHSGQGGYIYQINLRYTEQTQTWAGVYGVAVRVPGYTNIIYYSVTGGSMQEANLLFDCLEPGIENEVYASFVPSSSIDWGSVVPATVEDIDTYLEVNTSHVFSASNTFTQSATYEIGTVSYTSPSTFTFKEGEVIPATFDLGILKDGNGNILIATHIANFTTGFNGRLYNYQMILPVKNGTNPRYYFFTDPNDVCPAGEGEGPEKGNVYGTVTDTTGIPLQNVIVDVAGYSALTNAIGFYNISTAIGEKNIFAVKTGYAVYYNNVTVEAGNQTLHNIVLETSVETETLTGVGPGVTNNLHTDDGPGEIPLIPIIEQPKLIEGQDYIISVLNIDRKLLVGNFLQEIISFYSFKKEVAHLTFSIDGNVSSMIELDKESLSISPNSNDQLLMTIFGQGATGLYTGNLTVGGSINETINISLDLLSEDRLAVEALLIRLEPVKRTALPGSTFQFETDFQNLLTDQEYPVQLTFTLQDSSGNKTIWTDNSNIFIKTSLSMIRNIPLSDDLLPGDYVLRVSANYLGLSSGASTTFKVLLPFYQYRLFGLLKLWQLFLILIGLAGLLAGIIILKRRLESQKRYHLTVEYDQLPKIGPKSIFVGKIAETSHKTYFTLNNFKTHTIVAGATGGGKSFAAQGLVEEALLKNTCVFVFDPTAQWSGMLRKCTDKTILSLYPDFGMKPTEARAFNGNIRQITNPLEKVDIKRYLKPGEIQIFAVNKMDPKDIDIFVANTIKEVFHADFDEAQDLRLLLVYDEVHRLLPKFGGSGEGFLQIERGCREFRKWGLGILLISQVLADFVGQIKANINTELQMRTRDEGDLERIRVKYGEGVLQSLVKASVGTGMVENPAYNRGKPYFVSFRPILHSVQRLTDDELEKYNKYNDIIDDLSYQLEQLEELKIDVFDLKLELKLALDKVKSGNFNMVDIYTEGLIPRIKSQWKKLGKEPKKYKRATVSAEEIQADIKKAQAERAKYEAEHKIEEKKEEAKVEEQLLFTMTVPFNKALNFNNGATVTSLQELADVLPGLSPSIYKQHVNKEKNEVADWVSEAFDKEMGDKIRDAATKDDIIAVLKEVEKKKTKVAVKAEPEAPKETPKGEPKEEIKETPKEATIETKEKELPPSEAEEENKAEEQKKVFDELSQTPEKPEIPKKEAIERVVPEVQKPETPVHEEEVKEPVTTETPKTEETPPKEQVKSEVSEEHEDKEPVEQLAPQPLPEKPKEENTHMINQKIIPQEKYFYLQNGHVLKNITDLKQELSGIDDENFNHHVNDQNNDFANWVIHVFEEKDLGRKILDLHTKEEMATLLDHFGY